MDLVVADFEIIFLFFVLILASLAIYFINDLIHAVIVYGAYSLAVAIIWLSMNTPDVAITEAAAGISVTILMMVVIYRTNRKEEQ